MNINYKTYVLAIAIIAITSPMFSQNSNTISSPLQEVIIEDVLISSLLEKAITHEAEHKRGNNTFDVHIKKHKNKVELTISFLDEVDKNIYNDERYGFLILRNNLFFICGHEKIKNHRFFKKTKNIRYFNFIAPTDVFIGSDETTWSYYYIDNQYILNYLFDGSNE